MENSVLKQATEFLHERKNNKRWHKVLICLAVLVVLGTTAALMVPGQALNHKKEVLDCQVEVHEHTADCYMAGASEFTEEELICGQADYVVHVHNEDCYDENENLVCTLPEIKPHEHTEECFVIRKELVCGLEETDPDGGTLVSDGDAQPGQEVSSETSAEGHVHTDACYEEVKVKVCGEWELHTHDESCYDEEGNLICGLLEVKEHIHDRENCFETVELTDEEVARLNEQNNGSETEETEETMTGTDEAEAAGTEETAGTGETEAETEETTGTAEETAGTEETEAETEATDGTEESGDEAEATDEIDGKEEQVVSDGDAPAEEIVKTAVYGNVEVTASYGPEANIPEEAELQVYEVTPEVDRYEQRRQEALKAVGKTEKAEESGETALEDGAETSEETGTPEDKYQIKIYNIGFFVDGEEFEPDAPVKVTIRFLDDNGMVINEDVTVLHFAEDGVEPEELSGTVETEENAVNFEVDGFSDFAVAAGASAGNRQSGAVTILYTMAGVGLVLAAGLQYKKKLRERRINASRN